MDTNRICLCAFLLLLAPLSALAEGTQQQRALDRARQNLSIDRVLLDVAHLSSHEFNGRQTGTPDDVASGLFMLNRFQSLNLQASGARAVSPDLFTHPELQGWAQAQRLTVGRIESPPQLEVFSNNEVMHARAGTGYLPILDAPSVNVMAPVVFVGYGIEDPAHRFDEYAGIDVHDRIVLFLRGQPKGFPVRVSHAEKERTAREKGAIAFMTVTGPILSAYEARRGMTTNPLAYYGRTQARGQRTLPGAWISPALAERILNPRRNGQTNRLRAFQERLNESLAPQSRQTGTTVHMTWQSSETTGWLVNTLGLIPGHGPRAHETVVVGAHRDHFGRQGGLLFPGADDNASGTATLLEVARILSQSGARPSRSILFASFSGEEQGLLGSRLYVNDPPRPLSSTVAMINVDHAGIGNGRLTVGVNGLPEEAAAEAGRLAGLADQLDLYGYFPGGDHVPFKESGVPTIVIVSAGKHPHFHQPSDHVKTLKPEVLEAVTRYLLALLWVLAYTP